MLESLMNLFKLAFRQKLAVYGIIDIFKNFAANFLAPKKFLSSILIVAELIGCVLFDSPVTPRGQELDLTGYNLVFCDEFDGDTLDMEAWRHRGVGSRRGGFNAASQAKLENGNLVLTGEYLTDGEYGEGWYTGAIALNKYYNKGYFEIRCKCNPGVDFWSAFWIQALKGPYDHYYSQGGVNGAEIDIFEAMDYKEKKEDYRNAVTSTIHCNGVDDDIENIDSCCLGSFKVGNDIYNEFNTYGLEWTEDEYIFYINGIESARSSFGKGVSQVEEEVIVSLEIPESISHPKDFSTSMVVDYVKIYQK